MNGVERRLTRLEKRSRDATIAEAGLLAIERFRAGTATDADVALLGREGALTGLSDEDLSGLIEETRQRLRDEEARRTVIGVPGAGHQGD
jgi:hypothetical protein